MQGVSFKVQLLNVYLVEEDLSFFPHDLPLAQFRVLQGVWTRFEPTTIFSSARYRRATTLASWPTHWVENTNLTDCISIL
jgi:hypothetical protein